MMYTGNTDTIRAEDIHLKMAAESLMVDELTCPCNITGPTRRNALIRVRDRLAEMTPDEIKAYVHDRIRRLNKGEEQHENTCK